jgi:hypothetical protein
LPDSFLVGFPDTEVGRFAVLTDQEAAYIRKKLEERVGSRPPHGTL